MSAASAAGSYETPGDEFHAIAYRFRDRIIACSQNPSANSVAARDQMFDEVAQCLSNRCFSDASVTSHNFIRHTLPVIWNCLLPNKKSKTILAWKLMEFQLIFLFLSLLFNYRY